MRSVFMSFVLVVAGSFVAGCASVNQPLETVPHVDLSRYMGDWNVIANIPYFAEKNCVDSVESYALRSDGKIDNWFACRDKSFDAPLKRKASALITVKDTASNAVWSVKFFKVISVSYLILDLDANYQWAVVGHPSRRYGWIFARGKTLPDTTYRQILQRLERQGYDTARFTKVPQSPGNDAVHLVK